MIRDCLLTSLIRKGDSDLEKRRSRSGCGDSKKLEKFSHELEKMKSALWNEGNIFMPHPGKNCFKSQRKVANLRDFSGSERWGTQKNLK